MAGHGIPWRNGHLDSGGTIDVGVTGFDVRIQVLEKALDDWMSDYEMLCEFGGKQVRDGIWQEVSS